MGAAGDYPLVERWLADHEIDALLDGRHQGDDGNAPVARVLAHVRDEFRRPVSAEVAHRHLEAMLAAAPPAPVAHAPRVRPRRLLALVACMGMTFAYGGLSVAGALPAAVDVPHHVHEWFGGAGHGDRAPTPTMGAVVDPHAHVGRFDPPALGHGRNASDASRDDGAPHPAAAATSTTSASTPGATAPGHGHDPGTAAPPATANGDANGNANEHSDTAPGQAIAPPGPSGATPANGATAPGQLVAPGTNAQANAHVNADAHADTHANADAHANTNTQGDQRGGGTS
jgi:hypothetical protein